MKHFTFSILIFFNLTLTAQIHEDSMYELIGHYATGIFDDSAVEILAYDPDSKQIFYTDGSNNAIGVLNISSPAAMALVKTLDMSLYGGGVNSVAVANGIVAVASEAEDKTNNGKVVFFDTQGNYIGDVEVGALPDMVTFNNAGTMVLSANEGEPNDDYTIDPEGSVSLIDISNGIDNADAITIGFEAYNDKIDILRAKGIRIFGPNATVAQDLEPEYVTVTDDDQYAFVALQENNAMVKIDLATGEILDLFALGLKDHRFEGNGLDASNRTDDINIATWPVFGMYQPDAIKAYTAGDGQTYILTANEGDSRDYDGFSEEARVNDLTLNTSNYPNAEELQTDDQIGRLKTTISSGTNSNGITDVIHTYGTRSFSIWDVNCKLIWDSGDAFEQILAELAPDVFNSTNDDNDSRKNRSDDKGVEPEAINVMMLDDKIYALIGAERQGGIYTFDVTDPTSPVFVDYFNNRNFDVDAELPEALDLGIEDIKIIKSEDSPTGQDLIVTGNEVSGTISIFAIKNSSDQSIVEEENPNCASPESVRIRSNSLRTTVQWSSVPEALGYRILLIDPKGNEIEIPVSKNKIFLSSNVSGDATIVIKSVCENEESSAFTSPEKISFSAKSNRNFLVEDIIITEASEDEVKVFPNPFKEVIAYTVELSTNATVSISLTTMSGRKISILNHVQLDEGIHPLQIDLSNQPSGMYILSSNINGITNQEMLIKQ